LVARSLAYPAADELGSAPQVIILADNGSAWYVSGKPDSRWNDGNLHTLSQLLGSNFEAVDATVLRIDPNSGAAVQNGVSVAVSPASATVRVGHVQSFTATVNGAAGAVTWSLNDIPGGDAIVGTIDSGGNATVGTVSQSGLYNAPAAVPQPATVTVTATAAADQTKTAAASVTVARRR
jgi:hypothetical protein